MIRAVSTSADGRRCVWLGLSDENIARLACGQPVRVNLQRLHPAAPRDESMPDVDVMVFRAGAAEVEALMSRAANR